MNFSFLNIQVTWQQLKGAMAGKAVGA